MNKLITNVLVAVMLAVICTGVSASRAGIIANPTSISGSVLWLDASDTGSISDATDAGLVESWTDKSTAGDGTVTATGSLRPQTGAEVKNSKNLITLDGSQNYLAGSAVLGANDDDYTYFSQYGARTVTASWPSTNKPAEATALVRPFLR